MTTTAPTPAEDKKPLNLTVTDIGSPCNCGKTALSPQNPDTLSMSSLELGCDCESKTCRASDACPCNKGKPCLCGADKPDGQNKKCECCRCCTCKGSKSNGVKIKRFVQEGLLVSGDGAVDVIATTDIVTSSTKADATPALETPAVVVPPAPEIPATGTAPAAAATDPTAASIEGPPPAAEQPSTADAPSTAADPSTPPIENPHNTPAQVPTAAPDTTDTDYPKAKGTAGKKCGNFLDAASQVVREAEDLIDDLFGLHLHNKKNIGADARTENEKNANTQSGNKS